MAELIRPGVEVIQTRRTSTPTIVRPVLAPCVVGPAYEVVNVTNTDGTINSKALYGAYTQIGKTITQSSFPDPRGNLTELNITESAVRPFMLANGNLSELLMAPGESFLVAKHAASRATVRTGTFGGTTLAVLNGMVIQIAIDNPAGQADKSKDVVVTFVSTGTLTAAQVAAQINGAFGAGRIVATVGNPGTGTDFVEISSTAPTYGAGSSVTIRGGASGNLVLGLGGTGAGHTERVEGSGFRGQDDVNGNTTTPWIEFYRGVYLLDGVDTAGWPATYGLTNVETGVFSSGKANAITFGTGNSIPIAVGDYFYADGVKVSGGEVSKVESTRFKVGTINTALSTADSRGRYTTKIYNPYEVGTIFDGTPFTPRWTWFKANGLNWQTAVPTAAVNTGSNLGAAATNANVTGGTPGTFPASMTGLTLHTVTSINGVLFDNSYTFSGSMANMAAVATAVGTNITGLVASGTNLLTLTTALTGAPQAVTVKMDGTANAQLGFSTTADTVSTGTSVATQAAVVTSGQVFPTTTWFTGGAKTLVIKTSVDGGTSFGVTYTLTAASEFASQGAALTAINALGGFTAAGLIAEAADSANIRIRSTGVAGTAIKIDSTSSGLVAGSFGFTSNQTGYYFIGTNAGADVTFPPVVATTGQVFPTTTWSSKNLVIKTSSDYGVTFTTAVTVSTGAATELSTQTAALNFLNTYSGFSAAGLIAEAVDASNIRIRSTGVGTAIKIDSTSTGTVSGALRFTLDLVGYGIAGHTVQVQLSNAGGLTNPSVYVASLSTSSLVDAVAEINRTVGATVASIGGAGLNQLVLTSQLKGIGATISVLQTKGAYTLGVNGNVPTVSPAVTVTNTGSGRPFPDAYLDSSFNLVIGAEIVRDSVTGYPFDPATSKMSLYIQYNALRLDVSAVAHVSGVLRISDPDTLLSVLHPLTDDNPLGLGLFLCMLNAPNLEIKGLGIDEVTAGSPYGSPAAYTRAAAMLESEELYALAPLTQDTTVHSLFQNHVLAMSAPDQGGERIVFQNRKTPIEKNAAVALSGTSANSTSTINQLLLDANPSAGLVAAGKNPAQPFTVADGVYLEFTDNSGNLWRYNVSSVSGSLVNFNLTFTSTQNLDAFYSTVAMNYTVINASYSLKVRGASLNIPGSNPARLDYSLVSSTVGDANATIANRRCFSTFPDTVVVPVNGIDKSLPGFYACAAIAGMCASKSPQQGFTNYPIAGLTGVKGTEKFSKKQLNNMAGGGTYILIQDTIGGPVISRHQLSTDLSAIETRELSITKVVDYVAKFLRVGVRRYIGTFVINKDLLDSLSTTVHGLLSFLEERGVLIGSNINKILQDTSAPDTVIIDVTLDVPYPCNYIRLTLVI